MGVRVFFGGRGEIKRLVSEAVHIRASAVEIKNSWSSASPPTVKIG
jgi:hypothetical protein